MGWKEIGNAIGKAAIEKLQDHRQRLQETEERFDSRGIGYWSQDKLREEYRRGNFYEKATIRKYLQEDLQDK